MTATANANLTRDEYLALGFKLTHVSATEYVLRADTYRVVILR